MIKSLAFSVGFCVSSFVFLMVSFAVTEENPMARAAMGGIGILGFFLAMHFAPKSDYEKETLLQKFVFGLEIIMLILAFLIFVAMIGMIQESLVESGYISGNVCIECGP
jgi:hypothetical protein